MCLQYFDFAAGPCYIPAFICSTLLTDLAAGFSFYQLQIETAAPGSSRLKAVGCDIDPTQQSRRLRWAAVARVWGWVWGGPWARLLRPVAFASAFDQLSPRAPPACPGFGSDCHQLLLPFRCWWLVLRRLTLRSLDFTFPFEPVGFGRLTGFWPDTWVERLPLRITDLILPFLSTSHVHLRLCCVVKSILR